MGTVYSAKIYRLLSSEEKPTGSVGDMVIETDTGRVFAKEANGWAEVITVDNLKSGQSTGDMGGTAVVFATEFATTPGISLTPNKESKVWLTAVSTTGFTWDADEDDLTVDWIATDAGNP